MSEELEKFYYPERKKEEKISSTLEIPQEIFNELEIIAKRVGGDFGMKIKVGEPGGGSFFDPEDCSITFDPLHIIESPQLAKFVAGHEGAHRAISPSPKEIGLNKDQLEEYYSQIGFGYLQNAIEDPAVNDWMKERFPGLEPYMKEIYDKQFEQENVVLSGPDIQRIAAQLGYWPKFAQYGTEVIRYWRQKRFSAKLDPAVEKALQRTVDDAQRSITTIPDPQKRNPKEIIEKAQERFKINTQYLWPEVKKLVDMDLHTEEKRQMINEFRQKQKELEQKREQMKGAKKSGDQKLQEELQKEIEGLEKELDPFNQLPEDVKKELQKKIDEAIREGAEQLNKEIEKKEKQIESSKQRVEELEREIQELEEKLKSASEQEKDELEKELKKKKAEKLEQELTQKQAEQKLKDVQDTLEKRLQKESEDAPFPEDKLSKETKQKLEELFKKLPRSKKQEFRERAERQLEDFEDALNEEMESKLNKDIPENHQKRRERKRAEREIEERKKIEQEKKEELERKLEKLRREKMTEYDKTFEEVANIIIPLYNRLKNFLLPERHPKWRKGYPGGQRVNLEKAMQAEADPRYLEKIWERKTIPHKFDYRFVILVDLSGSMQGEKIEETFKGVVVLTEVFEKLSIQYEIIGFSDENEIFKQWREKVSQQLRDQLGAMKKWGGGGTALTEATQRAYQELIQNLGKDNFLITLTDGQPNDGKSLKELLDKIKEERRVKLIGIGLGPDTEHVKDYYPNALPNLKMRITEKEKKQGQKDFAETFADLLADMIRRPEKY